MRAQYLDFCKPDTKYYEAVERAEIDFAAVDASLPEGWQRVLDPQWCHIIGPDNRLPKQGWKIHVSVCPDTTMDVLETTMSYCFEHGLTFKFIRSPQTLFHRNSKYGERSASGKFVTIYPKEHEFEATLEELDAALRGAPAPYILSDLRYRQGPLYVRYGGFQALLSTDEAGNVIECIEDPDGNLVPDRRSPVFRVPEWVKVPECLNESIAARSSATISDFPFRVRHALHFSNGGGVYLAEDVNDGSDVIVKEGRPFAGLDSANRDAVERLKHAQSALQQLSGVQGVPQYRGYFKGNEHEYLIREHVEGIRLTEWIEKHNPIFGGNSLYSREEYAEIALRIVGQLGELIKRLHGAGIVFGDLHPDNVIVDENCELTLIDFETCSRVEDELSQSLAAPGFIAPANTRGTKVDDYALACLAFTMFLPLPVLIQWGEYKLDLLFEILKEYFDLPAEAIDKIRRVLSVPGRPSMLPERDRPFANALETVQDTDVSSKIERLSESLKAAMMPEDPLRLVPGDIAQYLQAGGGTGIGSGAAGVLYALAACGVEPPQDAIDWLIERTKQLSTPTPGYWNGLAGVAYVLEELGLRSEADEVLARCLNLPMDPRHVDLASGPPGLALVLCHFGLTRDDHGYVEEALLHAPQPSIEAVLAPGSKIPGGVMTGPSGLAIVEHLLARACGDEDRMMRAAGYLACDFQRMGLFAAGDSVVAPFHRPNLLTTCGTLLVASRFRGQVDVPRLEPAIAVMTRHMQDAFFSSVGLMGGRAGLLATLADVNEPWVDAQIRRHTREIEWHGVAHSTGYSYLGEMGLRLSEDLATGTAGVLVALQSTVSARPLLPFITCGWDPVRHPHHLMTNSLH